MAVSIFCYDFSAQINGILEAIPYERNKLSAGKIYGQVNPHSPSKSLISLS